MTSEPLVTATALIGATTGLMSLLGGLYFWGYKWGKLETMVKLLWEIDVEDSLRRQRRAGLIEEHSKRRVSQRVYDILATAKLDPLVQAKIALAREKLTALSKRADLPQSDGELAHEIIFSLGLENVKEISAALEETVQGWVSIVVVWVREQQEQGA